MIPPRLNSLLIGPQLSRDHRAGLPHSNLFFFFFFMYHLLQLNRHTVFAHGERKNLTAIVLTLFLKSHVGAQPLAVS